MWRTLAYMPRTKYFTVDEVATLYRRNPVTVRRWIQAGELGAILLVDGAGARKEYGISEADLAKFDELRRVRVA